MCSTADKMCGHCVLLYLKIIERVHLHNWPNGVKRQRDLNTLIGHQWSMNGQRTGGDHPKTAETYINIKVSFKTFLKECNKQ